MRASVLLRVVLTIVLLVGVYGETGPWTTVAFGLCFLGLEMSTLAHKQQARLRGGKQPPRPPPPPQGTDRPPTPKGKS